jgi:hypothetical protein
MNEAVCAIFAVLSVILVLTGIILLILSFIRFGDEELRHRKFTFILIGIGLLMWVLAAACYWLGKIFEPAPLQF